MTLDQGNGLTEREVEVVTLVAQGLSNKQIGKTLFVTENTIKTHLKRISGRLDARNRAHIVSICMEKEIIK